MNPLTIGATGVAVSDWQRTLQQLGYNAGGIDGDFGGMTASATRKYQVDRHLPATGTVGPAELSDSENLLSLAAQAVPGMAGNLLRTALSQLGMSEDPKGSNKGPEIQKFWTATNYGDGTADAAPWCAAFQAWCFQQAMKMGGTAFTDATRPQTASAWEWLDDWAPAHRDLVDIISPSVGVPQPGDIVVFTFHHIAMVERYNPRVVPSIYTVEGNSNDDGSAEGYEVVRHSRMVAQCRGPGRPPAATTLLAYRSAPAARPRNRLNSFRTFLTAPSWCRVLQKCLADPQIWPPASMRRDFRVAGAFAISTERLEINLEMVGNRFLPIHVGRQKTGRVSVTWNLQT